MTTYMSSSYSFSSVMFSHISTDASTLSTASGTFQPRFGTGTPQSLTSHLTVTSHYFQSAFGATSMSHCMDTSLPSTDFQPRLCGWRCGLTLIPFHICTWRYTWRLWYLAADDVGGRFSGCRKRVLVDTFWWMRSNLNLSSVSPTAPLYIT